MRNPHRERNIELGLAFGLAWPAFVVALIYPDGSLPETLHWILGGGGLTAGVMLTVLGFFAHLDARRLDRMRRGEGVLGRWRVEPTLWPVFADHAAQLKAAAGWHNSFVLPADAPDHTVEVVVSTNGVAVDGDFHGFDGGAMARAWGAVLEVHHRAWRKFGPTLDVYRVPLPPGAEAEAERIVRHYEAEWQRTSRPVYRLKIFLWFLLGLAAFILIVGWLTGWQ